MAQRTVRFEFDTDLRDDVSRPFNLARGTYVIEYAVQLSVEAATYKPATLSFSLDHLRTAQETHRFDITFPEAQPGKTTLGRQCVRVPGGPYYLVVRLKLATHAWIRILRI